MANTDSSENSECSGWKLVVVKGPNLGREYMLLSGNNLIGRWDPDCGAFPEIDLESEDPDSKISRKHAVIECHDGNLTLEDLSSLNGTYLNRDSKLESGTEMELKAGDEITVGKTSLVLKQVETENKSDSTFY